LNESSNNDTAELLNDYALLIKADLIVVLKENKSFFERIFKSDPAKKIIKKSMLPVLVFHEKE
jgi:nucleotide-binding universal stress UspA family protein